MSLENVVVVEVLLILLGNLDDVLLELGDLESRRIFSVPDLLQKNLLFHLRLGICIFHPLLSVISLLRIESFQHGFWYVHLFQLLKVHNQYVSFPNLSRIQDIVEEYSRKYFLPKLMDSRLSFLKIGWYSTKEPNGRIGPWNGSLTLVFFGLLTSTKDWPSRRGERLSTHGRFYAFCCARLSWVHPLPGDTFSVTTITDGYAREQFPLLLRGPDCTLSRLLLLELRPASDPVDSDSSWRRSPP